jgi:MFS family permease
MTPQYYGIMSIIPALGFLLGGLLAGRLANIFQGRQIMLIGILIAVVSVISLLILSLHVSVTPWDMFLPIALLQFATALIFPNSSALATRDIQDKSTASSTMTFLNMGIAVVSVFIGGLLPITHASVLPILLSITLSYLIITFWCTRTQ